MMKLFLLFIKPKKKVDHDLRVKVAGVGSATNGATQLINRPGVAGAVLQTPLLPTD